MQVVETRPRMFQERLRLQHHREVRSDRKRQRVGTANEAGGDSTDERKDVGSDDYDSWFDEMGMARTGINKSKDTVYSLTGWS